MDWKCVRDHYVENDAVANQMIFSWYYMVDESPHNVLEMGHCCNSFLTFSINNDNDLNQSFEFRFNTQRPFATDFQCSL